MWSKTTLIAVLLALSFCLLSQPAQALPISVERRDGDFDSLLSELKAKGSRMRFGKRSSPSNSLPELKGLEYPNLYLPDRYMWLL